jgi:hypothetical protein
MRDATRRFVERLAPRRGALDAVPAMRAAVVAGALVGLAGLLALGWWVVLPSETLARLHDRTRGLVSATLLANVVSLAALAAYVRAARIPLHAVGLRRSGLGAALATTVAFWALLQAVNAATGAVAGVSSDGTAWWSESPQVVVGRVAAQLLGAALFEEVAFRGFLLGALYALLARRPGTSPRAAMAAALIASLLAFAAYHLPRAVALDASPQRMLWLAAENVWSGLMLGYVYLQTANVYAATGVHALLNVPLSIAPGGVPASVAATVAFALWAVAYAAVGSARDRAAGEPRDP